VIDALLFVFGRRSKQIRSAKVAELIHRSEAHPELESATVTVTFQEIVDHEEERDAFDVVPNSTLEVSRVARKNGSSTYYINGKSVQFKELADLLLTKGIDLDNNRFLILQGEVEQISLMKPKGAADGEEGLLEYLEDIIGTAKYVEPIQEKFNAVEAATEERAAQLHRVQIVEKDLKQLEGAKGEAVDFLQRTGELKVAQAALYALQAAEADEQRAACAAELAAHDSAAATHAARTAELTAQKAAHEATYAAEEAAFDAVTKEVEQCKREYEEHMKRDVVLTEQLKYNATSRKKLAATLAKDQRVVADCERDEAQLTQDIGDRETEAAKLEKALGKEEAKLDEIVKSETEQLHAQLQQKQAELQALAPPLDAAREAQQLCAQEQKMLADQLHGARDKADAARAALDALREQAAQLDGDIADQQAELDECAARRPRAAAELADARKALERHAAAVGDARASLADAQSRVGAQHTESKVWAGLNKAKQQGLLPGIHGRLGDLATIDEQYNVAASTACPALNNIVVDTIDTAQKCIKLLRKYDLGSATFIVLDKMAPNAAQAQKPCAVPPGSERLFDLLRDMDAQHVGAFYFAFRDTLVARDLTSARQIAFGARRWRVVTTDGALIDISGTMSGGGGRVAKGLIKSVKGSAAAGGAAGDDVPTSEQLQLLERAVTDAELAVQQKRSLCHTLEQELVRLDQAAQRLELELPKLRLSKQKLPVQIGEAERECEILAAAVKKVDKKDEAKLAALTARLGELDAALAAATAAFGAVEADVKRMEKEILSSTSVRCTVQRSKVEELAAALESTKKALIKARVELKGSAQKHEKAKARLDKLKSELADADAEGEKLTKEYEQLKEVAGAVKKRHRELQMNVEALNEQLLEKRRAHAAIDDSLKQLKALMLDAVNANKELQQKKTDAEKRLSGWEAELDKARKLWARFVGGVPESVRDEVLRAVRIGGGAAQADADADADADVDAHKDADMADVADADPDADVDDKRARASVAPSDASASAVAATRASGAGGDDDEFAGLPPLPVPAGDELARLSKKSLHRQIVTLESAINGMKPNMAAIDRWREKNAEYASRQTELQALTERRDALRTEMDALRKRRLDEFMAGFGVITMKLKEMYQMITLGGDAELELVDSLDPFSEGIVFSVRPPKKSWKQISNLSGGEKTLSSLALVFALHHYKPSPLYVMDEIDAALDFKNVSIVGNWIKERTKNAQFLIISLRNYMFELAEKLVGIYKVDDCTRSVTITPREFEAQAAAVVAAAPPPAAAAAGAEKRQRAAGVSKENVASN
jgi:structural maintenance of chromosome 4